jgi:hypothetical protein
MGKRRRAVKTYSIARLLSRQPLTIRKDLDYPYMLEQFHSSPRLKSLRINRRCYMLLNMAKISPRNLEQFYRTYRLPKDPFFPLFFKIKRSYLQEQQRKKEEKVRYIAAQMRRLPPDLIAAIKYLARLEAAVNSTGNYPVWTEHLFPKTKKRVHEYYTFSPLRWMELFRIHLERLLSRYRRFNKESADRVIACFLLELIPENDPLQWPDKASVIRQFRKLSKQHHPDRGGNGEFFIELKWACDVFTKGK